MVGKWLGICLENWVGTWLENSEELVGKWLEKLFRNDWKNHWEKGRWLGNEREMIANRSEDGWNMLYKQFLNGGCIGYTTLVGKSVLGIWLYVIPYIVSPYLIYSGNMCISACVCLCVCVQFLRCTMKENNYDTWMWNMNEHDPGLHQVLRHEARLEGHHSRRGRSLDNDVLSLNKLFVLLGGYYDEIKCAEVKTWNTPKPKWTHNIGHA